MISEYEIGRHGWIMVLAFLSLASSCVTLSVAIRSQVRTVSGKIGVTLLMISAAGMTIAAVFTTDPITASQEDRKSTRLNSSHANISYAVFCLKKKKPLLKASSVV